MGETHRSAELPDVAAAAEAAETEDCRIPGRTNDEEGGAQLRGESWD